MRKFFSGKLMLAILMSFSILHLKAYTYYISPTGDDKADGLSPATAWLTITKVNSMTLAPGTVVLFQGGAAFPGSISLTSTDGNDSSNPILISSYGGGRATIQSGAARGFYAYNTKGIHISNLVFEGSGMSANATDGVKFYTDLGGNVKLSNIQIRNVEVRNYGIVGLSISASNYNTGFKDVIIDSVHVHDVKENGLFISGYTSASFVGWCHQNVTIRNSEVNNVPGYADPNSHRGSGIIMAEVDGGVIENCAAHHNGASNTHCGGPGGIWAYDCNNITIQHCESYKNSSGTGCDGLGFDLDGGMTNSLLQYNYSHENDGAGYLLGQYDGARAWSNNVVRYNISENDGRTNNGGITLFKGANCTMNGCKIYQNTIYTSSSPTNSGVSAFSITQWNTGVNGVEVYNNIFQTAGGAMLVNVPTGYDAAFAGNLYWSSGSAFKIYYHGNTYSSVGAWRTASGKEQVGSMATGVTGDPLLLNAGSAIVAWPAPTYSLNAYTTSPISPAANVALDLNSLFGINSGTVDFFNTTLPSANLRDIGAYENPASMTTGVQTANAGASDEQIKYFPNPLVGGENLHLAGGDAPYVLEFFTINGAAVLKETVYADEFHIPDGILAAGVYIIRVVDAKRRNSSGKIVVY
jgi:hypothetical protein